MAPLPSNNTGVLFVDYSVGGETHTIQARYPVASSVIDVMTVVADFLAALGTTIYGMVILGARHRAKDAAVTLPIAWTGEDNYGTDVANHAQSASYFDFIGRSIAGRRVRISVFGAKAITDTVDNDFRIPATGLYSDALEVLRSGVGFLCAIDGEDPVWYDYVNCGINAYWRNTIR